MDLARNLKSETVSRLNPTQAYLIQVGQPVVDAIKLMRAGEPGGRRLKGTLYRIMQGT